MSHLLPFPIEHFETYCNNLKRVGIDPGYVMYTDHHASNHQPAARLLSRHELEAAQAYIAAPSDEAFTLLVKTGVMLDTQWDRETGGWQIISFKGWEVLHTAFSRLHLQAGKSIMEITGVSQVEFMESL